MMLTDILASTETASWDVTVVVLLCLLPITVLLSGFFSGSETALFSLDASQRQAMRVNGGSGARQALALLSQPRMLLITLLLGNMTVNVFYFVISSSLLMWWSPGWIAELGLALLSLLVIVLLGEVLPKMAASAGPQRFSSMTAPILTGVHHAIVPVRVVVNTCIITPMSRLTGADHSQDELTAEELERLLALSSASGVVNREEQQTISDVLRLGRSTVRKAMTPRTKMVSIDLKETTDRIQSAIEHHGLTRLPVHGEDLDDIRGVLSTKSWLRRSPNATLEDVMQPATFIPEVATLERALEVFREDGLVFAVVVDEYGGTSGVLSLQDIVEELIGDIAEPGDRSSSPPRPLGPGKWIVDGDTSIRQLQSALGRFNIKTHVSTLGGYMTASLGHLPETGDTMKIDGLKLEVHHADRGHITSVIISLDETGATS